MSKLYSVIIFAVFSVSLVAKGSDQQLSQDIKPQLGQIIENYQSSIVSADGSGLPIGQGSVSEGKTIYLSKCAACHGIDGKQAGNQLVGGENSLAGSRPLKTVGSYWPYATTLFDYISRAMPYNQAKSLSADETYAVSAYILNLNGILSKDDILDEKSLSSVKMPNMDGFVELDNVRVFVR